MFFLNLLARATTWISRGAMCAPVFLLLGCPPGPETPETIERPKALLDSVFRPKWVLDTTIGVFELVDMNGCAKSLCTQRSAELARVCWEVQPIDGRIWTRNNDGEPCSCRCPELLKYTRSQADSLRAVQQIREAKRVYKWVARSKEKWARIAAKKKLPEFSASRVPVPIDSLRYDCMAVAPVRFGSTPMIICPLWLWTDRESMARWVFSKFTSAENYPFLEISFTTSSDDFPSGYGRPTPWRDWELGDDSGALLRVEFPPGFVNHTAVGWELMAFMVAHELGHALGDSVACSTYGGTVCEGQCDHWGASVAMRRAFPDGPGCYGYLNVAQRAADQLENYMLAVYGDTASCGFPMETSLCNLNPNAACGYPPMDCRKGTVEAAICLLPEPDCTRRWTIGRSSTCP